MAGARGISSRGSGHPSQLELRMTTAVIAALLGIAAWFRLAHLSSMPGIDGDEGWWGVQALGWLKGQPYLTRTTSGNTIDMELLIPVALVHELGAPSFFLLRSWPAFSNLLALVIGFFFLRRTFGLTTAWIQTLALAIAPTAIAHSRICQDPSQSILWTSLVMYLCLLGFKETRRWWLYSAAALVALRIALRTHPTNVFIAPFLVLPLASVVRRWIPVSRRGRLYFGLVAAGAVAIGTPLLIFVAWPLFKVYTGSSWLDQPWFSIAWKRLSNSAQWFEYVCNYGRLMSGETIYQYFSGAHVTVATYVAVSKFVAAVVATGMVLAMRRTYSALDCALMFAWATMWLLFFAFAGPDSIRPGVERWGLCLIGPATLVVARGLTAWIQTGPRTRWATIAFAAVVGGCLLGSFYVNYVREFETTGGRAHRTFITAATEPKQQAIEWILARRARGEPVTIVAQDWWQFWPLAYLAKGLEGVAVQRDLSGENEPGFRAALARGELYFVEFVGSPELVRAQDWIRARHLSSIPGVIQDAGGTALFAILRVSNPPTSPGP
jgi:hypothetical protein